MTTIEKHSQGVQTMERQALSSTIGAATLLLSAAGCSADSVHGEVAASHEQALSAGSCWEQSNSIWQVTVDGNDQVFDFCGDGNDASGKEYFCPGWDAVFSNGTDGKTPWIDISRSTQMDTRDYCFTLDYLCDDDVYYRTFSVSSSLPWGTTGSELWGANDEPHAGSCGDRVQAISVAVVGN
jgi:hypothetical protein